MKYKNVILIFVIILLVLGCNKKNIDQVIDNDDIIYNYQIINDLKNKLICKEIINYFIQTEYQNNYIHIYELYGNNGIFPFEEAFKLIIEHEDNIIYKNIKLIESYSFYGIDIEVHKFPYNSNYYYLVIVDISKIGSGYEILLFDENEIFLDKFKISSKWREGLMMDDKFMNTYNRVFGFDYNMKFKLYQYIEIYENNYGIVSHTNSSGTGYYIEYIKIIVIENNKFKEIMNFPMIWIDANDWY